MKIQLEIISTNIFPKENIASGVVTKNISEDFPLGLSFSESVYFNCETVLQSKRFLAEHLGIDISMLKFQNQVHGDNIQVVDIKTAYNDSDAMISNISCLAINVKIADCAGILIYDPIRNAIAAVHSGWRGTKLNIVKKTIEKMESEYHSKSSDLLAYISPSAGGDVYEVGSDVAFYFPNSTERISNSKYLFDNKKEIFNQLIKAGLKDYSIEVSNECSISNSILHSYRRDREKSGRMTCFIMMK